MRTRVVQQNLVCSLLTMTAAEHRQRHLCRPAPETIPERPACSRQDEGKKGMLETVAEAR